MNVRGLARTGIGAVLRAGRFAWVLTISVAVLVACINQRFSVTRVQHENMELQLRLERLHDDVERARGRLASLSSRTRIEGLANEDLALHVASPGSQVYLPEWTETPPTQPAGGSLATGFFGSAGRGLDRLLRFVGGHERGEARAGMGR
jgi:cell division protein FtsL